MAARALLFQATENATVARCFWVTPKSNSCWFQPWRLQATENATVARVCLEANAMCHTSVNAAHEHHAREPCGVWRCFCVTTKPNSRLFRPWRLQRPCTLTRRSALVGSTANRFFLNFRIRVRMLEQTSTIAIDLPHSHTPVAKFALDPVRNLEELERLRRCSDRE